jgi:hypothetical protein
MFHGEVGHEFHHRWGKDHSPVGMRDSLEPKRSIDP